MHAVISPETECGDWEGLRRSLGREHHSLQMAEMQFGEMICPDRGRWRKPRALTPSRACRASGFRNQSRAAEIRRTKGTWESVSLVESDGIDVDGHESAGRLMRIGPRWPRVAQVVLPTTRSAARTVGGGLGERMVGVVVRPGSRLWDQERAESRDDRDGPRSDFLVFATFSQRASRAEFSCRQSACLPKSHELPSGIKTQAHRRPGIVHMGVR